MSKNTIKFYQEKRAFFLSGNRKRSPEAGERHFPLAYARNWKVPLEEAEGIFFSKAVPVFLAILKLDSSKRQKMQKSWPIIRAEKNSQIKMHKQSANTVQFQNANEADFLIVYQALVAMFFQKDLGPWFWQLSTLMPVRREKLEHDKDGHFQGRTFWFITKEISA